jgi:signal transduction histidine kinase/ActR/RegA family two-component response regulator
VTDLNTLFSAMPHGAVIVDTDGIAIAVNARCAELCHIDLESYRPQPLAAILAKALHSESVWRPTGDWERDSSVLRSGVRARGVGEHESALMLRLIETTEGISLLTLAADRTGYLLDALMRNSYAGVFVLDREGTIVDCNALAVQLARSEEAAASGAQILGREIDTHLRAQQLGSPFVLAGLLTRARERGRDISFATEITIHPEGCDPSDVEITIAPLGQASIGPGEPAAVLFLRDPAEKREVRHAVSQVQHAREISRAAMGIAHELNNSATALITHLGILDRELPEHSASVRDELGGALSAVRRIRRLGMQMERFSGMEPEFSGESVREDDEPGQDGMTGTVLSELVQDTVGLAVSGTAIQTSFMIEDGLPAVAVSSSAVSQALFNVVINAVEAMDEEGRIHFVVHRRRDPDRVVLEVRDEGHGMDPRLTRRAFEPYFSTKPGGIGMGLTVALSALRAFEGDVDIESEPGFGTTVRLVLRPAGSLAGTSSVTERDATSGSRPLLTFPGVRVLLVEDDPLVRRSIERTLQMAGCVVTSVASGDRAIDIFRGKMEEAIPFDALITDLTMPGRNDGVQLLRRLRELDPEIPAVLSSGALHRQNISSYRDAGFQYVLRKPFGEMEIRNALARALAERDSVA